MPMKNEPTDNKISDPVITPSGIVLLYADQFAETKKITGKKWLIVLCFCTAIIGLMICVFEIRAMYLVNKYVSLPYVIGSIHALHSDKIYKKYVKRISFILLKKNYPKIFGIKKSILLSSFREFFLN